MDHNALVAQMEADPRYQRAISKMLAMSPRNKALLNLMAVDNAGASEYMRREVNAVNAVASKRLAQEKFNAGQKYLTDKTALAAEAQQQQDRQTSLATGIALSDVVFGSYLGQKKMKLDLERAKQTRALSQKIAEMTR